MKSKKKTLKARYTATNASNKVANVSNKVAIAWKKVATKFIKNKKPNETLETALKRAHAFTVKRRLNKN